MTTRAPTISVLMTVYNAGRFLDASIRSIHRQAFQDWEFVIVDDASTDGSLDVCRRWSETDGRIRVITNSTNKGQTPCLNQGLREARGKWIARQDADDLSHPMRLTRQFELASCDPALALIGTSGRIIDEGDRLCGLLDVPLSAAAIRWSAAILNPFLHTAVMFRREVVLAEFGGYRESFVISQDYDLWCRVLERHPSANLPDRLVAYRVLASSLSRAGRSRAFEEARQVSERMEPHSFGRGLTVDERRLVKEFREADSAWDRSGFWRLHSSLISSLAAPDRGRLIATHRLKAAGNAAGKPAVAALEALCALGAAPRFTAGWLVERMRG